MSITLATKLVVVAAFAGPLAATPWIAGTLPDGGGSIAAPAAVEIAPGNAGYRAAGEFTRTGKPVEAPMRDVALARPLWVMIHQVSGADYRRCADAGACKPLAAGVAADRPVVQVSFREAERYAAWLTRMSGETWRLPTDEEWAYAAGSRWRDDAVDVDAADPSRRALARYERESALKDEVEDGEVHPAGRFGANERGLVDLAGNVWEWTSTCYTRTALDANGAAVGTTENCGVRVVEGRHRAYVTDFIRDARGGGCSAGVPPTHLGFRLVREPRSWRRWLSARLSMLRNAL